MSFSKVKLLFYPVCEDKCMLQNKVSTNSRMIVSPKVLSTVINSYDGKHNDVNENRNLYRT